MLTETKNRKFSGWLGLGGLFLALAFMAFGNVGWVS